MMICDVCGKHETIGKVGTLNVCGYCKFPFLKSAEIAAPILGVSVVKKEER
jgi:uncharacterized CHY-type Zn-finger protein